ncbi:hypothetical protein C8Q75DRAFT_748694 [Abortiporus biennis]|nr:hypothetical protein C8Q75DRAFT_748694 [Abortiporus biennis]
MPSNGHRHTDSVSQNHKAQLANAYNELGKELSSHKIRVVGNYTLGKVIGEGTYGKVRLGVHRLTGTRVAIKQIPKAMSASLTREIHHHRQLHHPNVTQLYEVIATESNIWLVTELCSGGELFDYLAEKGRLGEDEVRTMFGQLCLAVNYVHDKGIVHRDLKLENVLLDERCRVKLGDFGFTREFDKSVLLETFCGTTGYAAPEMLLCKKYLGPEVDVWSLGVILYTLLTGTLPFDDDDDSIMREKVIIGEYEDPDWLSDEARDLIKNILVVDPAKRLSIAQILAHPWFTVTHVLSPDPMTPLNATSASPPQSPTASSHPLSPAPPLDSLVASTASDASNCTFHSASAEFPSTPITPEEGDVFHSAVSEVPTTLHRISETTLKSPNVEPNGVELAHPSEDSRSPGPNGLLEPTNSRPSLSRSTSNLSNGSKAPPTAYPTRTPARTKRRSVSSTLSEPSSPTAAFEKPKPLLPQDFSSLLSTPAPIIFSTSLERDLLNNLSSLGFDTGQIVHSVLTDACDATGALWWMLKRKAERKPPETPAPPSTSVTTTDIVESLAEIKIKSVSTKKKDEKEGKTLSLGRSAGEAIKNALLPPAHSAPELQLIPATPTTTTGKRPVTPPRARTPTNPLLSPTSSTSNLDLTSKSHPSTPGGSLKEKDTGSKGRKARAGSVSIMQRATTALEAAGLVRKKSTEAVKEEKEKSLDKRVASGDEPRASHGSSSSKAKSPPLKAVKDLTIPSTPPSSFDGPVSAQVGSPWVLTGSRQSPPPTPANSPGDTLGALPNIAEHSNKLGHRNRASLLSAFRMWFKEDPKGKRKEAPSLSTSGASYSGNPGSASTSPITGRGRGTIKRRPSGSRLKGTGRKANHRSKRASVSSRRSSSVNSRRSSVASQLAVLETHYSSDQMAPMTRQRSDPSRRSFGSRTPNSEREDYVSRPSSIQSFHHHRHRKSPSASSAGSMQVRTSSPLPKYHRRAGSGSSTRVVRQMTPSISKQSHLRSNSASSNQSLTSSRRNSLYELSESEGLRTGSPFRSSSRLSFDETPRRSKFVAQKRQTPFSHPAENSYLNSLGRSSWKKSWGMEPPSWQTRSSYPVAIEVLAISPEGSSTGLRDVFSGNGRHSLSMGDESDWIDEDDDVSGFVGGLGQMPSSASSISSPEPTMISPPLRSTFLRQPPSSKRNAASSLTPVSTGGRNSRTKTGGRSPAGRSSPLPNENTFETSSESRGGGRRQIPTGRSGPAFRQAIQEEDEDEEEE